MTSTDNRTTELLPCPFCGGVANVIDHHNDDGSVSVGCDNDTCLGFSGLGWLYKTEAEAIAAWNARAERTCHNASHRVDESRFHCSVCEFGCWVRDVADGRDKLPSYCPKCGAKIEVGDA